jgi:hypothetical protein
MRKLGLLAVVITNSLSAQSSPCDLNGDGAVNVADVQIAVNEALGLQACTMNLDGTGTCDVADVQRVISAALGGACVVTNPTTSSTVTLPVEVIGPAGTTQASQVSVPSTANLTGVTLWAQIHNFSYPDEVGVQVNNGSWISLNSSTVTLLGNANAFGGIGGGFHTLTLTVPLPAGTVTTGTNTVTFRFNKTDGNTSGFRVLNFNFMQANGTMVLPSSQFVQDDPSTWQPPSTLSSDISAGQTLWQTASLTVPPATGASGSSKAILAHCSDCHSQDGRDLKYFNYSNNSIEQRAMFHGLSATQGAQIASYIRSLNTPSPGRPWNPPYQPGPGLDSQAVESWSAGAGLSAVLDSDTDMVQYISMPSDFASTANINVRETPMSLQFPDWNHWLPKIHPMDAFGAAFSNGPYAAAYPVLRSGLVAGSPAAYAASADNITAFIYQQWAFTNTYALNNPTWTPLLAAQLYSARLWAMIKLWEVNQEFGLEGMPTAVFPAAGAEPRAWYGGAPFLVSPHMIQIPTNSTGVGAGDPVKLNAYLSLVWYLVQMTLNDGNGLSNTQQPIDWAYSEAFIENLASVSNTPQAMLETFFVTKALQVSEHNYGGTPNNATVGGPEIGTLGGWLVGAINLNVLVNQSLSCIWLNPDGTTASYPTSSMLQGLVQAWFNKIKTFTPAQFYAGNWTTANAVPAPGAYWSPNWVDQVYYMIPRFTYMGVSPALMTQVSAWAKTIWPNGNWAALNNSVCTDTGGMQLSCTGD